MSYPHTLWRFLKSPPAHGAWNMAVDEAILQAVGKGEVLPTLRVYSWEPPCLSLGYAQPFADVDLDRLRSFGWEVVRRPTGGKAILHTDELTYSVIGPTDDPRLAGSVLESYRNLAQALLDGLHLLGIPAQANENPQASAERQAAGPVCFEVPSNYEITVGGKKLIGSAQARRKEGVLQHGSLPLVGDLGRIVQALSYPDEDSRQHAAQRIYQRATTLEAILGFALPWQKASEAFFSAFEDALNLDFVQGDLLPNEIQRAEQLVDEKYAHPSWTEKA
jgi:lipoate-protein ligase A